MREMLRQLRRVLHEQDGNRRGYVFTLTEFERRLIRSEDRVNAKTSGPT